MTPLPINADLVRKVASLPTAKAAEVAHVNAEHPLPWDGREVLVFDDGCRFEPVTAGCWIYSRPDEVAA